MKSILGMLWYSLLGSAVIVFFLALLTGIGWGIYIVTCWIFLPNLAVRVGVAILLSLFLILFLGLVNTEYKTLSCLKKWFAFKASCVGETRLRRVAYLKFRNEIKRGFSREYLEKAKEVIRK